MSILHTSKNKLRPFAALMAMLALMTLSLGSALGHSSGPAPASNVQSQTDGQDASETDDANSVDETDDANSVDETDDETDVDEDAVDEGDQVENADQDDQGEN